MDPVETQVQLQASLGSNWFPDRDDPCFPLYLQLLIGSCAAWRSAALTAACALCCCSIIEVIEEDTQELGTRIPTLLYVENYNYPSQFDFD